MKDLFAIFDHALKENQITLMEEQQRKLIAYLALLQKWNTVFNLTTITDPRDNVYLHLVDSLLIAPFLQGTNCLDVGTGAGLPGIPLSVMLPKTEWMLLDKNSKKTRFLTQVIAELALPNVRAEQANVLQFHPSHKFDSILSRAFGTIRLFAENTTHLLNPNGLLLAMKGRYPQDELAEVPPDFVVEKVVRLTMKGVSVERHLVLLRKVKE